MDCKDMCLDTWLELLEQRHTKTIDLGLQRCGEVFRLLGSPQPAKTVFTVAGTNGKGSTVAYLGACAAVTGQRHGAYTSPHILKFNERISIMGEPVSDDCLVAAFEQVESARGDILLSYFEFTTLAGFLILHAAELDCAILEVGLGGRLDTVNLIDADCAVIAPIGMDHQDYLGTDIESIATEKAGVIRAQKPVVCTQQQPPEAILLKAAELASPVYRRGHDFFLQQDDNSLLLFSMDNQQMQISPPAMSGQHQQDNLAAALAAFSLLNADFFNYAQAISETISSCHVPGRMQLMGQSPDIYLDVGHNPLAAQAIATFLDHQGLSDVVCVLAMLADKDVEAVALQLERVCSDWLCTRSTGERGQSGQALAQRLQATLPDAAIDKFEDMEAAMNAALSVAGKFRSILVFGSFTSASEFLTWRQTVYAAKPA